jgi:hypothetical protein
MKESGRQANCRKPRLTSKRRNDIVMQTTNKPIHQTSRHVFTPSLLFAIILFCVCVQVHLITIVLIGHVYFVGGKKIQLKWGMDGMGSVNSRSRDFQKKKTSNQRKMDGTLEQTWLASSLSFDFFFFLFSKLALPMNVCVVRVGDGTLRGQKQTWDCGGGD